MRTTHAKGCRWAWDGSRCFCLDRLCTTLEQRWNHCRAPVAHHPGALRAVVQLSTCCWPGWPRWHNPYRRQQPGQTEPCYPMFIGRWPASLTEGAPWIVSLLPTAATAARAPRLSSINER